MARLWMAGAEIAVSGGPSGNSDGGDGATQGAAAQATRDTSLFRSGAASYKFDAGAGNAASSVNFVTTTSASRNYFCRGYANVSAAPSSAAIVLKMVTSKIAARLRTDGALELLIDGVATGSPSAVITDGSWHRIELGGGTSGTNNWDTPAELQVDGVTVATGTPSAAPSNVSFQAGWQNAPGANKVINFDDLALQDSTGATNTTWIGDSNIILMRPTSDNARGNWTAGAGGTTNLFDAVDNSPPVGVADASATNTSQIKIKSTTLPSSCDLNLASYTTAGVPTGATVNAVRLCECDGEDPSTGTKAGTIAIVSNPAAGPSASFNFGDDAGAQSTYSGGLWVWRSLVSDAPTVTLGTAVVVRVTCSSGSTGTRAASCCFLGMYVDYTPAASGSLVYQPALPTVYHL